MALKIFKIAAFPKTPNGGNPAGVVLNADNLDAKAMQKIAKEMGYSETAFVLKSEIADFLLRFFTPINEVDLCGHATIATFNLLRDQGIIETGNYTQETKVGVLKLIVKEKNVYMEQILPLYGTQITIQEIEECFNEQNILDEDLPSIILSTGMSEIFVPIKTVEQLNSLIPKIDKIIEISLKYNVIGIHCFALTGEDNVDAYGRNFAPIVGINEESATGTSNGALGCYLNKYVFKNKTEFTLRQGYSMNKPSEIMTKLTIEERKITSVFVGGSAIKMNK